MTFIASVIAREGVAIVADSFTTSMERILDEDTFIEYLKDAPVKTEVQTKKLATLFKKKPSYTRNYTDKLFQFGKDSAITTTGMAYLNGKLMKDLVGEIAQKMKAASAAFKAKDKAKIVDEFAAHIKTELLEHLKKLNATDTDFIFSTYDHKKNAPRVFVISIESIDKEHFDPANPDLVKIEDRSHLKVITDGQDIIVDRLIFGSMYRSFYDVREEFLKYLWTKIDISELGKSEIEKEVRDFDFLRGLIMKDFFYIKFRELSLQEAVDFATLLIKIVMDIQVYTEKIPTVGGVIRLAVISKQNGFKWLSGDEIIKPKII